jgi:hypothetical protein
MHYHVIFELQQADILPEIIAAPMLAGLAIAIAIFFRPRISSGMQASKWPLVCVLLALAISFAIFAGKQETMNEALVTMKEGQAQVADGIITRLIRDTHNHKLCIGERCFDAPSAAAINSSLVGKQTRVTYVGTVIVRLETAQ